MKCHRNVRLHIVQTANFVFWGFHYTHAREGVVALGLRTPEHPQPCLTRSGAWALLGKVWLPRKPVVSWWQNVLPRGCRWNWSLEAAYRVAGKLLEGVGRWQLVHGKFSGLGWELQLVHRKGPSGC